MAPSTAMPSRQPRLPAFPTERAAGHAVAGSGVPSSRAGGAREIAELLSRHVLGLMLVLAAALVIALVYLALAEPRYSASSSLFIDPRTRKIVSDDVVQGGIGTDTALFESQVSIIGSDAILRRVVERMSLQSDPEFASGGGRGLMATLRSRLAGTPPPEISDLVTRTTERLSRQVRVRRAQNTYVVTIEATASTPDKAASIANEVADAYLRDQAAAKADGAARVNMLIDGRLDELRRQLRTAETAVDSFKRSNRIVTSEGGMLNEQQLTRLNTELVAVRAQVASTKARLEELNALVKRGAGVESLPEAMNSPAIQRLREQYANVARREAALSSQLQPRHPLLVDVRAQLATARGQITAELQRVAAATNSEYQIAAAREREISREMKRIEGEVTETTTSQIRLRELEREADAARAILRAFLSRAKETQEQQNLSVADARVITTASLPLRPSSPQPMLILALAGLGGLGASLVLAAARERNRFPELVRRRGAQIAPPEAAIVGNIPMLPEFPVLDQPQDGAADAAPRDPHLLRIATALAPGAPAEAQGFRRSVEIASQEVLRRATEERPSILLLASVDTGAGTTTASFALALASARRGVRTLLVDADASDAMLSATFAGDLTQERPCVLDNKDDLAEIVSRDPDSGLALLPIALADLARLSERQRQRLAVGIARLASDFDVLMIDGGAEVTNPVLPALSAVAGTLVAVVPEGAPSSSAVTLAASMGLDSRDRVVALTSRSTRRPRGWLT